MLNRELDDEMVEDIRLIHKNAKRVWGRNAAFGKIAVLPSPYPEFEWPLQLYGKVETLICYDRSFIDVRLVQIGEVSLARDGRFPLLRELTNAKLYDDYDDWEPWKMLHDFKVLDKVVRKLCEKLEKGLS